MVFDLNAQRGAVDAGLFALLATMGEWLDLIAGPAQKLAMWLTIIVAFGRFILFVLDARARARGERAIKPE
ncbi:hypothetical protein GBZ48_35190 [Azospirillum melinis]|uniref:DUF1622 domain-containing protein n=1 Tax=Azospirillum melinis TaxID=328839 RepID=A0ABX2KLD6_9PROT|nr:hypothetical protein [Azospirillum melinis]MBP2310512.1 hypothetical protein [Azospirillum melinis]NUB04443.1 hypothetical protein [Azospirillum melinis]